MPLGIDSIIIVHSIALRATSGVATPGSGNMATVIMVYRSAIATHSESIHHRYLVMVIGTLS